MSVLSLILFAACPGCQLVLTPTFSERYSRSDAAVLARWVKSNRVSDDGKIPASATLEVLQVARGGNLGAKKGQRIVLPLFLDGDGETLYFVTGIRSEKNRKTKPRLKWTESTEVSETAYHYITQAPSPEVPAPKRLKYFLKFFEFPDTTVADDAYNEFAKTAFKHVRAASDAFSRKNLRKWLLDEKTPPTHIGLYGIMLGLCGTKDDLPLLEKKLRHTKDEFRMGIEGVIAGYLLIAGDNGMALIDRTKLIDRKTPFGETYMAIQAMRIMWSYGGGRVSRTRLKQSLRKILSRPLVAELILPDLARWKDWSVMDRVVKLYDDGKYDSAGYKRAAIQYLMAAAKDVPKDGKPPAPHVVAAKKHLAAIKKRDPKNYRAALRLVF